MFAFSHLETCGDTFYIAYLCSWPLTSATISILGALLRTIGLHTPSGLTDKESKSRDNKHTEAESHRLRRVRGDIV